MYKFRNLFIFKIWKILLDPFVSESRLFKSEVRYLFTIKGSLNCGLSLAGRKIN